MKKVVRSLRKLFSILKTWATSGFYAAPGHYYSPIPSVKYIKAHKDRIFAVPESIPGIDLRAEAQIELLHKLKPYYDTQPFQAKPHPGLRYFFENSAYSWLDGIFLHSMIRHHRPARIIEIGSGYTSALILDTRDKFPDNKFELTCIEPYPDLLRSLLSKEDLASITLIDKDVQSVRLEVFEQLGENDILLIDSTHVARIGSDVNYEFFEILPRLRPGVLIHIHDAFYPFEYPYSWAVENRAWNEMYMLRAFLQFNSAFQIVLFSSYLLNFHHAELARLMPACLQNTGGNIWLKRVS